MSSSDFSSALAFMVFFDFDLHDSCVKHCCFLLVLNLIAS